MPSYLENLRVLDLTDHRGLLAGHCMAHMGADVIQIEPPTGSPWRRKSIWVMAFGIGSS